MVKSIAERAGVQMPRLFGYTGVPIVFSVPLFGIKTYLFFIGRRARAPSPCELRAVMQKCVIKSHGILQGRAYLRNDRLSAPAIAGTKSKVFQQLAWELKTSMPLIV